ncbi:MAG: hypothetical protein ABSA58_15065, partial [Acetobacteraceae bacterium]
MCRTVARARRPHDAVFSCMRTEPAGARSCQVDFALSAVATLVEPNVQNRVKGSFTPWPQNRKAGGNEPAGKLEEV